MLPDGPLFESGLIGVNELFLKEKAGDMHSKYEVEYAGRTLYIESGKMAKQAAGSCTLRYGGSFVLITACREEEPKVGCDFMPLTVNYLEMNYAAGKIPGGFFKREGRPAESAVLSSRLIDRQLRPLFTDGYAQETQVVATVMSADSEHDTALMASVGASLALGISDIPFEGPTACIRVGRIDGELVANPSLEDQKKCDIDLIVAGSADGISMVEGGAAFANEDDLVEALLYAEAQMKPILEIQKKIIAEIGKTKIEVEPPAVHTDIINKVKVIGTALITEALAIPEKLARYKQLSVAKKEIKAALAEEFPDSSSDISAAIGDLKSSIMRTAITTEGIRVDGRDLTTVRPIDCDTGILPRAHGSGLFTRGETQAMVVATLGTADDEQRIDALTGWEYKRFMLHYNFLPFCVGEARFLKSPGRREIGHGALAERAVLRVFPDDATEFPYVVRIVSEIMESNGSSSMATICGASLALMDAGVPIKEHVAGIAMGLIKEGDKVAILSDILGDEDHIGDMDFKVAGTAEGVTALQMDIKISGVTAELLKDALHQARDGRMVMLERMNASISAPREEYSEFAPRIITIQIKPEKIKDIIGPGGKVIKSIVAETGVKINVNDEGIVTIASADQDASDRAVEIVKDITREPEVGKLYLGTVRKIMDFGAFIEIFPGTDGLCHISQLAKERVANVTDILNEGDEVLVKCIGVERDGKIRLSRKDALGMSLPEL